MKKALKTTCLVGMALQYAGIFAQMLGMGHTAIVSLFVAGGVCIVVGLVGFYL